MDRIRYITKPKIKIRKHLFLIFLIFLSLFWAILPYSFGLNSCLVRYLFKIPCPACGLTRAWISFFSLNFEKSFYYHPLFLLAPFLIVSIGAKNKIAAIVFPSLFIAVYIIRLYFFEIP